MRESESDPRRDQEAAPGSARMPAREPEPDSAPQSAPQSAQKPAQNPAQNPTQKPTTESAPQSAPEPARQPAGYSSTPQARKLGLKPGMRIDLDQAPAGWMLDSPPPGLTLVPAPGSADTIVAFFSRAAELHERLPALADRIFPAGALWIAWPRKAAGHVSDLGDSIVRAAALAHGIVDVKVAAIDTDWSGLKFVWRVADRTRR
ncbi:hypothetical protein BH09ACT6_BH09ACT6_14670 [soil metagenome]